LIFASTSQIIWEGFWCDEVSGSVRTLNPFIGIVDWFRQALMGALPRSPMLISASGAFKGPRPADGTVNGNSLDLRTNLLSF
jgi:hypothetical protein